MRKLILVGTCVAFVAGVLSVSSAGASSARAASQPTVSQVQAKINTLSAEFDRDVQQYDQLSTQLPAAKAQLKRIDKQVTNAEKQYRAANVLVAQAATAEYEGSGSTSLAQILTANDPSSALNAASQLLEITGARNEETENLLDTAQALTTAQREQQRTELGISQLLAQSSQDQNTINSLIRQQQVTLDVLTAEQQGEVDMSGGGNDARVPDPLPTNTPALKAVWFAYEQLGCPYVFGDIGPCADGFDCSGLMYAAWGYAGITLPRDTYEEWAELPHISTSQLQPGDLLIYNDIGHVAMYVGNGYIIDAPHTGAFVELIPMDTPWYTENLDGALAP
jgi:peptidoglycan DL-endopeptidase CwlO